MKTPGPLDDARALVVQLLHVRKRVDMVGGVDGGEIG
jgi:hypothetical protein